MSRFISDPASAQLLLRKLSYNEQRSPHTLRSAIDSWNHKGAHCLEAAFLGAAILERIGFPPLILSLESQDYLDHVVTIFRWRGKWGALGKSRELGLQGRKPVFADVQSLAESYYDPYVDDTGRVTGWAVLNLDDTRSRWRDSESNVWKAEKYLIELKHHRARFSDSKYEMLRKRYCERGPLPAQSYWW